MTRKKQQIRRKKGPSRDQRMEELRTILRQTVPQRVREIHASGKDQDAGWLIAQLEQARSVRPERILDQGKRDELLGPVTEIFAICSFIPGGTTAALGVKLFGVEFDAKRILSE